MVSHCVFFVAPYVQFLGRICRYSCKPKKARLLIVMDRVFIIDGIITVVVAIYGFIVFPDTPYDTKAFYLSAEEKERCLERLVEDGRQEVVNHFSWDMFKRAARTWQLYVLAILFM